MKSLLSGGAGETADPEFRILIIIPNILILYPIWMATNHLKLLCIARLFWINSVNLLHLEFQCKNLLKEMFAYVFLLIHNQAHMQTLVVEKVCDNDKKWYTYNDKYKTKTACGWQQVT